VRLLAPIQYLVLLLGTLVIASLAILFGVLGWDRATYAQVWAWAWLLLASSAVRVRAHGLEHVPDGPYLIISNHSSHLDGPALARALPHPVYFVIKKELTRIPLWGQAAVKVGFIAVDRGDSERARRQMSEAIQAVRAGRRVLVFAEGTRSPDGRLQPFKKGGFHLAVDAQVPILPVAVNGSHRLLPKGSPFVRPGFVDVVVAEPIPTAGLTKDDLPELMDRTREGVLSARRRDPTFLEP
jgi:1-acyl-sn-glycerol-3-phosphate acyltransferase